MSGSDYENPECSKDQDVPFYDPHCSHYKHEGKYTELQIGPARSQMHTFPLPGSNDPKTKGEYQWTEWFKAFEGNVTEMHSSNYAKPLTHVMDWMNSPTEGLSTSTIQSTDEWLEAMSSVAPKPEHMLYQGTPWGMSIST